MSGEVPVSNSDLIAEFQNIQQQIRNLESKYGSQDISNDLQCAREHVGDAMLSIMNSQTK